MLNAHSRVGVAQIILYIPAICLSVCLFFRHGRPRMAWVLLLLFSLLRAAGGIVVILLESDRKNTGLTIAAIALLNTGVAPLIVATLGLVRIILSLDFKEKPWLRWVIISTRALFLLGVCLLVAGASLEGQYKNPKTVAAGLKLVKAGYIVLVVIFGILVGFQGYFWVLRGKLSEGSRKVLQAAGLSVPFIIVRIACAFLSVFRTGEARSRWDALYGSVALFVVMVLVMEWIVVATFIAVGMRIPRINKRKENGNDTTS